MELIENGESICWTRRSELNADFDVYAAKTAGAAPPGRTPYTARLRYFTRTDFVVVRTTFDESLDQGLVVINHKVSPATRM